MKVSVRLAVHFTGRPTSFDAHTTTANSQTWTLTPKPPPTSGEITRILCSGSNSRYLASQRRM